MKSRRARWGVSLILGLGLAIQGGWRQGNATAATEAALFPVGIRAEGYKLGLLATACWMGGVWSDAEGTPPADWRTRDEQRCRDLVVSIYGRFDQGRYEQIRATESRSIDDLLAKIRATEPAASRDRTVTHAQRGGPK